MIDRELLITGYLDRFSHRPGETFSAYVSAPDGGTCRAKLVRVLSGDPNPKGPGIRFLDLSSIFDREFPDAARKSVSDRMELSITDRRDRVTPPAPGHFSVARPLPNRRRRYSWSKGTTGIS